MTICIYKFIQNLEILKHQMHDTEGRLDTYQNWSESAFFPDNAHA